MSTSGYLEDFLKDYAERMKQYKGAHVMITQHGTYGKKQSINFCPKCESADNRIDTNTDTMYCNNCKGSFKIEVCLNPETAPNAPILVINGEIFYKAAL